MRRRLRPAWLAGLGLAGLLALLALVVARPARRAAPDPPSVPVPPATAPGRAPAGPAPDAQQGFLYGRVTTDAGAVYEGRLRLGGDDEAFWGDTFKGYKEGNPWVAMVPPERIERRVPIRLLGLEIVRLRREVELGRPLMLRYGDIVSIALSRLVIRVTLKSGGVYGLDRLDADDLSEGLRVWDAARGVQDLGERQLRRIDLLPTARLADAPARLQGTLRTRQGDFSGFVQWGGGQRVDTDLLAGHDADVAHELPFAEIRAIAPAPGDGARLMLRDGRELLLAGSRDLGPASRAIVVEDPRYGRVLVDWAAFERVDFVAGGSGPAYADFPPGRPLEGSVSTRDGRRLTGRLVFDLDERETTETLDAPDRDLDYTLPFDRVAVIALPEAGAGAEARARVTLRSGETLALELGGDLGPQNAGILVFGTVPARPEHLPWSEVSRIELGQAAAP
ncbi:MAG: hypothetical protein H6648_07420 [Caldilineae bacterium]|nr:hypothetical protein [Caldilineae bacterium]